MGNAASAVAAPLAAVEVAPATEDCGPTYRSALAKDALATIPEGYPTNLWENFLAGIRLSGDEKMLGTRGKKADGTDDDFTWVSYNAVKDKVDAFAAGLVSLGLAPQKPLGIYAINRAEWVVTELACYRQNLRVVSLYDTLGPDAVQYIINHAEITHISCSADKVERLLGLHAQTPQVTHIVQFEATIGAEVLARAEALGVKLLSMDAVVEAGRAAPVDPSPPATNSELATIMYTSGTTGVPKGVLLTHSNIMTFLYGCWMVGVRFGQQDYLLSYLPLAHIFERVVMGLFIQGGGAIGFWRGSVQQLFDDILVLRPTIFPSVPRLFNRLFDKVNQGVAEQGAFKKWLFSTALESKRWYVDRGQDPAHRGWDPIVFKKIRDRLGGRVRLILTGSAPISREVFQFLQICFSCPVLQGYGSTETSAGICITIPGDHTPGHNGPPLPCCEVRLRDVADMSYLHTNTPPQGEVCVRGGNVTQGYYKNDEENKAAFDADGFFLTGDVARFNVEDGTFTVIDRKKSMFKLAHGEYLSSEYVESVYVRASLIQQIFVYGDSLQSFLVAIVVVDPEMVGAWVKKGGKEGAVGEWVGREELHAAVAEEMEQLAKQYALKGFEVVKRFVLKEEAFSTENGLLTPTSKFIRNKLKAHYQKEIDEMYAEPMADTK